MNIKKKIINTQFDILSSLNLDEEEEKKETESRSIKEENASELQELINTISINEKAIKDIQNGDDPLSLFEDLKGSDHTQTLKGLKDNDDLIEQTKETIFETVDKNEDEKTTSLDKSFFTKSTNFKKEDFEDFSDIEDGKSSVFVKIIIALLIIAFIAGAIILVKSFVL